MLHGRIGTLAVGGLAAYLLINKAMNIVGRSIDKICDAGKWKAYYKYSVNGVYTVAPGYSSFVRPVDEKREFIVAKEPERKNSENTERSETGLGASVVEAVLKAIKDKLDGVEAPEEASEGETEASEASDEGDTDKCVDTGVDTDGDSVDIFENAEVGSEPLYSGVTVIDDEDDIKEGEADEDLD
jgi:hypothetical protein